MPKKPAPQPVKPSRPRKQRIDGRAAAVQVAIAASKKIKPPTHIRMNAEHMPFFDNVIKEFSKADWTDHQLEIAALLARTICQMENEQWILEEEGSISYSDKGTPVVNPRKTVVQMCAGTILAMRRSLSLHARASAGDSRDVAKRQAKSAELEKAFSGNDDLLARPTTMH